MSRATDIIRFYASLAGDVPYPTFTLALIEGDLPDGWTGLDIGRDRGSPVSDYASPFAFTGKLVKVTVTMDDDQTLDADGVGRAQLAHD